MAKMTKMKKPTSSVPGVAFRSDGSPRWEVRIRWMVNGEKRHLPTVRYPVDLDAPKGTDTHIDRARTDAEVYAKQQRQKIKSDSLEWSSAAHHYTLRGILERYRQEVEQGLITTQEDRENKQMAGEHVPMKAHVRKSVTKELSAIAVMLGTATTGHNRDGFPDIVDRRMDQLSYDLFHSPNTTEALNWRLKGQDGKQAPTNSVKRLLSSLRTIINHAIKVWKLALDNPLATLKDIKINDKRERTIDAEEWELLCQWMERSRTDATTYAAIRFARYSAARRSEVCKLDWSDIDQRKKLALLRDTKANGGESRHRSIPLNGDTMAILDTLRANRIPKDLVGPVFRTSRGKRLRPDTITQAWSRAREAVADDTGREEIRTARLHDLRHTRVTELGTLLSAAEAAMVSGHRDMGTFMRYFNPKPEDIGRRIDALEAQQGDNKELQGLIEKLALHSVEDITAVFMSAIQRKTLTESNKGR